MIALCTGNGKAEDAKEVSHLQSPLKSFPKDTDFKLQAPCKQFQSVQKLEEV